MAVVVLCVEVAEGVLVVVAADVVVGLLVVVDEDVVVGLLVVGRLLLVVVVATNLGFAMSLPRNRIFAAGVGHAGAGVIVVVKTIVSDSVMTVDRRVVTVTARAVIVTAGAVPVTAAAVILALLSNAC